MGTHSTTAADAVADIVRWSIALPDWQQDALRRIVEQGELTTEDVDELFDFCRREAGFPATHEAKSPARLGKPSKSVSDAEAAVTLVEVASVQHCNVICEKQVLKFGAGGLTIVFGYNGSGKSGYGRVLRKACRARHRDASPILPNVLKPPPKQPASAEITFALAGKVQAPSQWIDGEKYDDTLQAISFFDAHCARVHVGEKNDIAFRPRALCILETLAQTCLAVRDKVEAEKDDNSTPPAAFVANKTRPTTAVGGLLLRLTSRTDTEKVKALAELSDAELERLRILPVELNDDPTKRATRKREAARRMGDLRVSIQNAANSLSDGAVETLRAEVVDWRAKHGAAELAAKVSFESEPLPDVGSTAWRQLWAAAKAYSTTNAFRDEPFPFTGDGARCVLCHQELDAAAADRLARFEAFVQDRTAVQADTAKRTVDSSLAAIRQVGVQARGSHCRELLREFATLAPDAVGVVRSALAAMLRRARSLSLRWHDELFDWAFPPFDNPVALIHAVVETLNQEAADLDQLSDPQARARLEHEFAELQDRAWLATALDDVLLEVERRGTVARLDECKKSCSTTRITTESKRVAKAHVTDALRMAFAKELKRLNEGVRRVEVELDAAEGQRGTPYYQVRLIGAPGASVPLVVSEGEHRCIALAGFLAELATEGSSSAIVFDDPVTSLDHLWKDSFAKRVVEEARERQVIVFTHDVGFLHSLQEKADENSVTVHLRRVKAVGTTSGIVSDDIPWVAQTALQRIDELDQGIRALRAQFAVGDDDAYARVVSEYYSRFRATIERVVVDVFFAKIVQRHRDYVAIEPKRIARTSAVTDKDWEKVRALHKTCCNITEAHDPSELRSFQNALEPDAIKVQVDELLTLVKEVKGRQNQAEKAATPGSGHGHDAAVQN